VYIGYFTPAWVDSDGQIHFLAEISGRDDACLRYYIELIKKATLFVEFLQIANANLSIGVLYKQQLFIYICNLIEAASPGKKRHLP
jgi:hypothetical protein